MLVLISDQYYRLRFAYDQGDENVRCEIDARARGRLGTTPQSINPDGNFGSAFVEVSGSPCLESCGGGSGSGNGETHIYLLYIYTNTVVYSSVYLGV